MKFREGKSFVLIGASRSGKSLTAYEKVNTFDQFVAYDYQAAWATANRGLIDDYEVISERLTAEQRLRKLQQALDGGEPVRIIYEGSTADDKAARGKSGRTEFDIFCQLVERWARANYANDIDNYAVIAEELSELEPSISKSSGYWGKLNRGCKKFGLNIVAIFQSPTEVDKTSLRQANSIHFCEIGDLLIDHCERSKMIKPGLLRYVKRWTDGDFDYLPWVNVADGTDYECGAVRVSASGNIKNRDRSSYEKLWELVA